MESWLVAACLLLVGIAGAVWSIERSLKNALKVLDELNKGVKVANDARALEERYKAKHAAFGKAAE